MFRQTILGLLLLSLPILGDAEIGANPGHTGWYAGGGVTYSNIYAYTDTCFGCYGEAEFGSGSTGFALTTGYRFMPYFGIELAYVDQASPSWSQSRALLDDPQGVFGVDSDLDLSSVQVSLLGILPFRNGEVYLRGGAAYWEGESDQTLTGDQTIIRTIEDDGTSFVLGVGGGWTFTKGWHINLDYAYYPFSDELIPTDINTDAYTDVLTLQLMRRFGASED